MFNQRYLHPWDYSDHFADESQRCSELLEEWLTDADKTPQWGTLVVRKTTDEFPSKMFSFSSSVKFGPARAKANPRLHPTGFQSHPKEVRILVPAKGPLPMGSFCGTDGYGLIHPNMISASVLQCCIASSQEADQSNMFRFDAMALAPNMDLLMSCKDAEKVAQTIAQWNCGSPRTPKMELIHPPGGTMPPKDVGSKDWNLNVQKEVESVFKQQPFRHWTPTKEECSDEQRRKDREGVAKMLKATENSLFTHMAVLNTQMGANLRAYHYLRNQELLGMKPVEKITLLQVKEVIDQVAESRWLNQSPTSDFAMYLPSEGGSLDAICEKFKGKKRLRVLWDVTGYEVARGSWSKPKTKEEYFKTLAVFWSMQAPLVLPSLPGVGCDPVKIGTITIPNTMWEEDDRVGCKYVPMTSEELAEPATPRRPSRVRNTPDVGRESWHPILSQSEHAYGWWMLSPDEQDVLIEQVKARSERAATSRLTPPRAKSLVTVKKEKPPVKPMGTTPKSGAGSSCTPAKATTEAIVSASGQPALLPMQGLVSKELKNPPPQSVQHSSAGVREQSNPRGKSDGGGLLGFIHRGRPPSMGQGTPSIAPDQAKGAVPRPPTVNTPPRSRSAERQRGASTPRTETPPRSRSEERSDKEGGNTPVRQSAQTAMSWLDSSRRESSAEPPREPPETSEGLGPILIGGHAQQSAGPPQEEERASSPGMISRAISAISSIGRGPRPTRGRSEERTVQGSPQPPSGDSDGDSSNNGSDVIINQNPVAQEPRIPARQRPEVPTPPMFREDEVLLAGIQLGIALQAHPDENQILREQLGGMIGIPPPRRNQPPDEPDPELPGASDTPSEWTEDRPTDATSTELIEDDSEETLDFHEAEEGSDNPQTTDNDPYEDAAQSDEEEELGDENPEGSQAEVRAEPDLIHVDVDESPEEAKESETPEQPSQGKETPRSATDPTVVSPPQPDEVKEKAPLPSKPFEFTGSIADWEKFKVIIQEQKHGKSPLKESAAMSSEQSAPQATPSETTSAKEDKEQSSEPAQGEGESSSTSQPPPAEASSAAASGDPKSASSEQTASEANPKSSRGFELGKLNRRRKPLQKPRQETPAEKAERERLEKIADDAAKQNAAELIAQEQKERQKLTDKEAKSKQAAAANTEKAREAADKARKQKEAEKADEKVPRSVTRRLKKTPEKEDGDPPDDDPTPWIVFRYRQPQQVVAGYTYEGASITNKMNVIDPQYTVNTKITTLGSGKIVTPVREVLLLQGGKQAFAGAKHRIRDIRSVQIERAFLNTMTLFPAGHMCNSKDGKSVVMRVSTPYSTQGQLLLKTLPGESPTRYTFKNSLQITHLRLEADFKDNKMITPLIHCVLHFATRAMGYKLKEGKVAERPAWFTPEVLRAARVFIKEVSSGQYTNEDHTKTTKPAFVYHPSVISNYPEEPGKGRFVHLISVGLQLAQVTWIATRQLPFYVRGLLRAVPAGLLPEVFAIASVTDPDIELCVDHHLMLWARAKNWDDYRPVVEGRYLGISYEETFQEPLATVVVSQVELAEAFLDQKDEGPVVSHVDEYDELDDDLGAIRAQEAPSIKQKPDPKKKRQTSGSPGKSGGGTRAAYLMPANRYPIAVPGAHHPTKAEHYSVIINVRRAVQYGTAFSPAVDKAKEIRGNYVTSGIPANAIVQIRTNIGQCVDHNSLGTDKWDHGKGQDVHPKDPTLKITGRAEMPSLEIYHEDLSPQELKVWNHSIIDAQQFSEDHMDHLLSDRALTKGLPPTNLSYAEFVGMRVKTLSILSFKNDQKEYNVFMPNKTPSVLLGIEEGKGSDSDDESILVKPKGKDKGKGKGKGKDKKGKGKGRGKFNPTLVPPQDIDPEKLIWTPLPKDAPAKGVGRSNYRALRPETYHNWVLGNRRSQAIIDGVDPDFVRVDMSEYNLTEFTPSDKRTKDSTKRQREQTEDPEKKRVRKGGPPAIPPSWQNRSPSEIVMSFTSPEVQDGYALVVLQSTSQVPAFGRYSIPVAEEIRANRVSENEMGHQHLWSPPTNPFWEVCRDKNQVLQYGMAASHKECALCIGAKAFELVPCCWCTNWVHLRCSYAVPEGRACASHFDVVNPLDKQVIASEDDEAVPEERREQSVCPNIATPRITDPIGKEEENLQPRQVMYNIEALWLYKHAWRGAGLYYRKGDHQVPKAENANKPSSMYKALNMYPVWDKWLMPRCEPIAERFYNDPNKWSLSRYDDDDCFGGDINDLPILGYVQYEYKILESLDYRKGNLFKLWYEALRPDERIYWHVSRAKAEQKVEYRWDDFIADKRAGKLPADDQYEAVVNFDRRFHYYDKFVDVVELLPDSSTKDQEEAKSTIWEIEGLELELCMAMDPESFAAKAMNPKKRKPDPETEGEGSSSHPAAKRIPGVTETPKASTSDSPSASQEPQPVETTPSDSRSASAIGALEPPRARPSHTPASTVEGTDAERQEETPTEADLIENELDNASLDVMTPIEQMISGNPFDDIETLIYQAQPGLMTARHLIDPVIRQFMLGLQGGLPTEEEDRRMREFLPKCFDATCDELMNSVNPIEEDVQNSFGLAVEVFPWLLPKAFGILRKILKRMTARHHLANPPMDEEEEARQYSGYDVPEFTQLLVRTLEEITTPGSWDDAFRTSLYEQLEHFLYNNTSVDPEYLVEQYRGHLLQFIQAQNKRLKTKFGNNQLPMLKESGVIKRVINQIPEAARITFERHRYNPDKKRRQDNVFAEAEYEEEQDEEPRSSTPKRPGPPLQLPEAKMAARPATMTSRNMKQDVIPSEAQVRDRSTDEDDNIPDDDLRRAMELSKQQMYHDPTETPDTGGSAASAGPSVASTPQEQPSQTGESVMTKKQLSQVQVMFNQACTEVEGLQARLRDPSFTTEDMNRLEYLQPLVNKCRKQLGILEARAKAESSQPVATTKRRTDDQGSRERSAKHRTLETTHPGTTGEGGTNSPSENIGEMFQKGVQEVPSSSPSSATTPTPIPVMFEQAASGLQTGDESKPSEADPSKPLSLPPTDPRSLQYASAIRRQVEKLKKSDQGPTPPKSGSGTARTTPSSGFDVAD